MDCPKCDGAQLQHLSIPLKDSSKIDLDRCDSCGGTWFDPGELDKYLKGRATDAPSAGLSSIIGAAQNDKAGKCPRCSLPLARGAAPGNANIHVDTCGKCNGVWFDGGELQQAAKGKPDVSGQLEAIKAAFG